MNRRIAGFAALVGLALLSAGCVGISNPDGWAAPEPVDDVLYVTLDGGELSALDATTYSEIWTFAEEDEFACGTDDARSHDLEGIYAAPAIDDERLYIGAYDASIYAVSREDGSCLWQFETDDPIVAAPVLGNEGLYVASTDGNLYVLDPETGEQTREPFAGGDIWSTPLLTDDALYVATMDGTLWKLDPETFEEIWDAPFDVSAGLLTAPMLAGEDTIVVGGIGEKLYGVSAATGIEQWVTTGANWFWGTPAVEGTTVYATTLGKEVMAVDATNGEKLWTQGTLESVRGGPVVVGDLVVAVDNGGHIYRVDIESGSAIDEPRELKESVYATPVLQEDGQVLIVARNGDLFTFDAEAGRSTKVRN